MCEGLFLVFRSGGGDLTVIVNKNLCSGPVVR